MNILFVCTGNTCRSPMAEALMRKALREEGAGSVRVSSAGIHAFSGGEASAGAVGAMAARGIDLTAHRATLLSSGHLDEADLVLGMTRAHADAISAMGYGEKADTLLNAALKDRGDIEDPFGGDADDYEAAAERIEKAVRALARTLARGADE